MWVFLVGMVAFAVDTAWMTLAQSELQNAADASALAAVSKLQDWYVRYRTPGGTTNNTMDLAVADAKTTAKTYAGYNVSGNLSSLALADADISVGFTDNATGVFSAYSTSSRVFPNTVKITTRRSSDVNGSLRLFFAPAIGTSSVDLAASSSAMLFAGDVEGPKKNAAGFGMLPATYDYAFWEYFVRTGNDANGNTVRDANGVGVMNLYTNGTYKGNFGLLSLDGTNANANLNVGWVNTGPSANDLEALYAMNLLPLSKHDATKWEWGGTSGMQATVVSEINEKYIGKTFLVPMFKAYASSFDPTSNNPFNNGKQVTYQPGIDQGSNYKYNIVTFAAVKIVDPTLYGGQLNRDVMVQPAKMTTDMVDFESGTLGSNTTETNTTNNGTSSTTNVFSNVFTAPKLTN